MPVRAGLTSYLVLSHLAVTLLALGLASHTDPLGIGIAGLLAVTTAVLLARVLTRPMRGLAHGAKRWVEGDFAHAIEPEGPREMRALATDMNLAAAEIRGLLDTLSSERSRLADLLGSMAEGVLGIDGNGRVLVANERVRQLLALPRYPIVGTDLSDLVYDDQVRRVLAKGTGDGCLEHGGRLLGIQAADLSEEEGFVAIVSDVTETERTEQMRRDFIANASHQLRSPLTSIRGYLLAIVDGAAQTEDERGRCLATALEQVGLLQRRVDKLLELSRLQAQEAPENPCDVLLGGLAERACEHIRPQAEAREVQLVVRAPAEPITVCADADLILEAIHNMLDNAIRHSPDGGTVTVSVEREECGARVAIADSGPGFGGGETDLLWKRFYSGQRHGAAGLGLAITQEIVRAHGGRVWAESNPEGGALFGFHLPCG
ncbi:MAG: HAMP domain-containing protein [Armatimonadia bacterium]|nr:HAMP domain-containing protein [Armatimonadia bacterium]